VAGVKCITALAAGVAVRTFVHMSSTSVYGPYRGIPYVESAPCLPQDDYGRSKRDGENVVRERMREGLPAIMLRPCTVYGPGCGDGAGKLFSRPSRLGAIPGNGAARLSNVRVEDVAAAAYYLSVRDDAVGQAFNIADGSHPTIEHALQLAAEAYETPAPQIHVPLPIVSAFAYARGAIAKLTRHIPDLEPDAVRYLYDDYLVSNTKLVATGYRLLYPDFAQSMHELGGQRSDRSSDARRVRTA
jgi:UDP-glucose 4-epimerase